MRSRLLWGDGISGTQRDVAAESTSKVHVLAGEEGAQASSPYHRGNPAASACSPRKGNKGAPSVSCIAKVTEGAKSLEVQPRRMRRRRGCGMLGLNLPCAAEPPLYAGLTHNQEELSQVIFASL